MDEAWRRAAKSTGRRLWVDRAAWATRGPEGEERIVTKGAKGIRSICSAEALHLAQAEEVNG